MQHPHVRLRVVKNSLLHAALSAALLLFAAVAAHGQVLYGTITGNVVDSSGAIVVSANVQAINIATGFTRAVTTNADGIFILEALQPGTYELRITSPTFSDFKEGGGGVSPNPGARVGGKMGGKGGNQPIVGTDPAQTFQTEKFDVNYE